jgi:hypothetical protein
MDNPLGAKLVSAELARWGWNFGSLGQRFSSQLWQEVIWNRLFKPNLSGLIGVLALSGGLFLTRENKTRILILMLLLAGLLPLFVFTNLHIVHTYYQMANCVFLLVALGLSIMAVADRLLVKHPLLHGAFLAFFIAANFYFFASDLMKLRASDINSDNNRVLKISDYVKAHTNANDAVIWYGFDWSSEPAFYAERKSLTVADWMGAETDVIDHTEKYLRAPPGAIVLCPNAANAEKIGNAITNKFGPGKSQIVDSCQIYLLTNESK